MGDVFGPPTYTRPFEKYEVYRKRNLILVFGIDKVKHEFAVLQIPKKDDPNAELELLDGDRRYPMSEYDAHVKKWNGRDGGLERVAVASGIIGFIRFLQGYYLILITGHKKVGKIGHHYVLAIENTMMVHLFNESAKMYKDEKTFRDQLNTLNLSKDFYFSHSYELSRTAQQNLADAMAAERTGDRRRPLLLETDENKHHRHVWNHSHMRPFLAKEGWQHWCLTVIHGFFAYTKCSSFGWTFEIALIARRSRFYAGTRYRKRGLNVDGQVANDVETEQLLCDDSTRHLRRGHVMSFVQIRGSVPLFWSQETSKINPKPAVVYPRCDTTLSATRLHFADLLERFGTPQLVVNLMRAKKVDSYEVRLKQHFESAIERLNRELPPGIRILYRPFDMKNKSKSSSIYDVFARLAESVVARVGFFHTCSGTEGPPIRTQSGVVRTNCVDCLDRTNVLQFFVGLEVLKQQLTSLNLLSEPRLDFESQVVFVLSELYDIMGDHLALQYAGSVAHKKYQILGNRPRMMTSSKEILVSIQRHYSNSWTDSEKQASLNLFLGVYQPRLHPRTGELDFDSWLHHRPLRDDWTPDNWWVEPLKIHSEKNAWLKMTPDAIAPHLTDPTISESWSAASPMSSPRSPTMDSKAWFREVHSVWKLTSFEKVLSRLEATFVQINGTGGQRTATLRPFRDTLQRIDENAPVVPEGEEWKKEDRQTLARPWELALPPESEYLPHEVIQEDKEAYEYYSDPRHLCRLLWESRPTESPLLQTWDLSLAGFSLVQQEEQQKSLEEVCTWNDEKFAELMRSCLSHHLNPQTRPRSSAGRRASMQFGRGASMQTVMPGFRGADGRRGSYPPPRSVKLRLCSYCDFPYNLAALLPPDTTQPGQAQRTGTAATAQNTSTEGPSVYGPQLPQSMQLADQQPTARGPMRVLTGGSAAPVPKVLSSGGRVQEMCNKHVKRAQELERLLSKSSLSPSEAAGSLQSRQHGSIIIQRPMPREDGKPWKDWLTTVERPIQQNLLRRSPSKSRRSQLFRAQSGSTSPRAPEGSHGTANLWTIDEDRQPPRDSSSLPSEHGMPTPLDKTRRRTSSWGGGFSDSSEVSRTGAKSDHRARHLWCYAFPHEEPPPPSEEELNLPDWWLQSRKPLVSTMNIVPATSDTNLDALVSPSSKREKRMQQNEDVVRSYGRKKSVNNAKQAAPRSSSPASKTGNKATLLKNLSPAGVPPRGGRSIFGGATSCRKMLDDILDADFPKPAKEPPLVDPSVVCP
eukprot:TRINITY_DN2736_c0_g1_i1.p1 TRINITY_DN2736_c0_g1~~TRINITY_DN2736_c0_g1_i1.p1  ORF type:complete len:1257 (-),score=215.71 TRINITY_DN2736_c0_g1_i1:15-3785(-)